MSLYVSRYNGYQFAVIPVAKTRLTEVDGQETRIVTMPEYAAVFRPKPLPYAARMQALQHFDTRNASHDGDAPGPIRSAHVSQDPDFFEMVGQGAEPWMYFTAFDTDTDISEDDYSRGEACGMSRAEIKALFERELEGPRGDLGDTYIKIERVRLEAPWPKYDEIVTAFQGHTKEWVTQRLAELADAFGADDALCAQYERENQARDYVLEMWEARIAARAERAAEDEALSVG